MLRRKSTSTSLVEFTQCLCSSAIIVTLEFNNVMIFFFGFHVSELKYAQEREAEDNNKHKHISKN